MVEFAQKDLKIYQTMIFFKRRYNGTIASKAFPGSGTFTRGVHPPQCKDLAHDAPIEIIPP
ncbi:MAG: hypothetical protein WCB15_19155 [Desulfobacterales bacterium]|jgi:hypothetical protein